MNRNYFATKVMRYIWNVTHHSWFHCRLQYIALSFSQCSISKFAKLSLALCVSLCISVRYAVWYFELHRATCLRHKAQIHARSFAIGGVFFAKAFPAQLLVTLFEVRVCLAKQTNESATRESFSNSLPFVSHARFLCCFAWRVADNIELLLRWMRTCHKASSSKAISAIGEWHCDFIQFYHWLVVFVVVSTVDDGYGSKSKPQKQRITKSGIKSRTSNLPFCVFKWTFKRANNQIHLNSVNTYLFRITVQTQ